MSFLPVKTSDHFDFRHHPVRRGENLPLSPDDQVAHHPASSVVEEHETPLIRVAPTRDARQPGHSTSSLFLSLSVTAQFAGAKQVITYVMLSLVGLVGKSLGPIPSRP